MLKTCLQKTSNRNTIYRQKRLQLTKSTR